MEFVTTLGLIAGTLTTISFLPQVIRIWKTHSTKDLSLGMFLLFSAGVVMWLIYGICVGQLPVIISNAVTLVMAMIILTFKFIYK
jgi:MtN3 and saliva related transmembrane protein